MQILHKATEAVCRQVRQARFKQNRKKKKEQHSQQTNQKALDK